MSMFRNKKSKISFLSIQYTNILLILLILSLFFTICCINSEPEKTISNNEENLQIPIQINTSDSQNDSIFFPPQEENTDLPEFNTTSQELVKTYKIGESVDGNSLMATEIGHGNEIGLVIAGGIHGNEKNTKALVKALETVYNENPALIPSSMKMFFLPEINPDGIKKGTRRNNHEVDLNRNFPTDDWIPDAVSPSKILTGSGGTAPGSEPEVQAVIQWLTYKVKQEVKEIYLISYHSAYPPTGSVQPGYMIYGEPESVSEQFARFMSKESGYKYLKTWVTSLPITGEFIHWCVLNKIWACDIELPDYKIPSRVPDGKSETTTNVFKRTIQEVLSGFLLPRIKNEVH